ncbi:MAG: hypothetical protein MJ229_00125 [bacterium]|nr:hypothetical protein [bacterium]
MSLTGVSFGSITAGGASNAYVTDPNAKKKVQQQPDQLAYSGSIFSGVMSPQGSSDASAIRGRAEGCTFDMSM